MISIIPLIVFSVLDEDIDFSNEKYRDLFPDMYKQDRDSKPFNIIKYLVITFLSFIISLILFSIFNISYLKMIRNSNGDPATFYDLIFNLYLSIIFIHFFMVYIDSSLFNYLIIFSFILQILADFLFLIIINKVNDNQLSGILGILIKSNISFFSIVISCASICLPFFILRRAELYFGMKISNLIKTNKLDIIYKGKFYRKKIKQMIRAIRSIAKFKKIKKDLMADANANNNIENNLIDKNMIKIVEHYNENAKYIKKKS
jgi:magnesium-transporting ATPase (P-type)